MITDQLKEDFLLRLYFNSKGDFFKKGANRAYLDFNRTLRLNGTSQEERNRKKLEAEDYLVKELKKIISKKLANQLNFDKKHRKLCINLKKKWKDLKIGQCQKWINMTLKYWLVFGEKRIPNIEKNYEFFHIPIDSYVIKGMFKEKNPNPWSQIDDYDEYMKYQFIHREKLTGSSPIIDEMIFFNDYPNIKDMNFDHIVVKKIKPPRWMLPYLQEVDIDALNGKNPTVNNMIKSFRESEAYKELRSNSKKKS